MKYDWQKGMRVRLRDNASRKLKVKTAKYGGYITKVEEDCEVMVQWDDIEKPIPVYEETRYLIPENSLAEENEKTVILAVQSKIDEATSHLEVAFESWREAAKLYGCSEDHPYELKDDHRLDLGSFEDMIESNGWRTSSLYC